MFSPSSTQRPSIYAMHALERSRTINSGVMERLLNGGSLGRSTGTLSTERRGESHARGMSLFAPRQSYAHVPASTEEERNIALDAPEFTPEKRMEIQVCACLSFNDLSPLKSVV